MRPVISVLTPTCDRPEAVALMERWMRRQTVQPDQWIVVDDGVVPEDLTLGQTHVRRAREPLCSPAQSFCRNLLAGFSLLRGDVIVVWENDDWYGPTHLETVVGALQVQPIVGDPQQRYFNIATRQWRIFQNIGASLCQTGFRKAFLGHFEAAVTGCLAKSHYGVDRAIWESFPKELWGLQPMNTVVGIKGLPGRPGLGGGHRPTGNGWARDERFETLRDWIGDDVEAYRSIAEKCA